MNQNCGNCKFADPGVLNDDNLVLWCKRYPPFIFFDSSTDILVQTPGPQVDETDWCGEWQNK